MTKILLSVSALLMTCSLFAAPAKISLDRWKSVLRFRNTNLTLNLPYKGSTATWNYGGGIVIKEGRWKKSFSWEAKENESKDGADVTVENGSLLQWQINDDDNTISAKLTNSSASKASVFFSATVDALKTGKMVVNGQDFPLNAKANRGGVKSLTFFDGDAAKCVTIKVTAGTAFLSWDPTAKHGFLMEIVPSTDGTVEFTIVPGME